MEPDGRVVLVTGAGGGIGAALATRFAAAGARGVVVSDVDGDAAGAVAAAIGEAGASAVAARCDVGSRAALRDLVRTARDAYGEVDILCSNAGVAFGTGVHAAQSQWERSWSVNVLAHVHAAQAVLPAMLRRGRGHLVITASAGGLLGLPGDAPYTVTKSAAVSLAEWLAVTYRGRGVGVSALCPLGVRTSMLTAGLAARHPSALAVAAADELITPDEVAAATLDGVRADRFLILPHAGVRADYAAKAADPDAWLAARAGAAAPAAPAAPATAPVTANRAG